MPYKCAVLDDYQNVAQSLADWQALEPEVQASFFEQHIANEEALVERLIEFDIIVAMRERTPFSASLLAKLPKLKLLVTTGMRNAAIDIVAAKDRGILVCGTRGSGAGTAELTFALMLGAARTLVAETSAFRSGGRWQSSVGVELHGRTLGIVGVGRLGGQVATIAKAFGMRVLAWSQNLTRERCDELGIEKATSLHDLLRCSDFVTMHLKLSERTQGLIDAAALGAMKKTAFLINTSRGPIVDEQALVDALENGWIAGAGLDVFDEEPLPADHPFRKLPNVIATPHLGYVTEEAYRVFFSEVVEDIRCWLADEPVRVLTA